MKNIFCALVVAAMCNMVFATPPLMVNLLAKHKLNPVSIGEGFSSCDSALALSKSVFSVSLKDASPVISVTSAFDRIHNKTLIDLDKTRGTDMTTRLNAHNASTPMAPSSVWFSSHAQHSVDCNRYIK